MSNFIERLKNQIYQQTRNGRTDVYVLTSDLEELGYRNIKEDERQFINAYVLQDLIKRYEFKHNLKVEMEQLVEKLNKEQNKTISDSWDEISK